jgi:hypothetical protein
MLVAAWFFVCTAVHFVSIPVIRTIFPALPPPKQKTRHVYSNHCTSLFHSSVMSVLFLLYWTNVLNITPSGEDIGDYETFCMDLMVGYLWYDTFYECRSFFLSLKPGPSRRIEWVSVQIIFHHILGFVSTLSQQILKCGIGSRYMMGIYGAELSTPFLHWIWILTESNMTKTRAYLACGVSLLVMFFWRNMLGFYIMYHLCTNWPLWIGSTSPNYDAIMYNAHVVITACFVMLNMFWTSKLVKKAMR